MGALHTGKAHVLTLVCVNTYALQIFDADSEEVQREWVRYTRKVDKKMEDAVRYTIKKSLQVGFCVCICVCCARAALPAKHQERVASKSVNCTLIQMHIFATLHRRELSRLLNGDKTEVQPIFHVTITLNLYHSLCVTGAVSSAEW